MQLSVTLSYGQSLKIRSRSGGYVRQGVEDGGEGVSGFAGLGVGHNFDKHAFVGLSWEGNRSCHRDTYGADRRIDVDPRSLQQAHSRLEDDLDQ